ncbi:hypothetical protein EME01_55380 [Sinorhizobium meliloti]|nr:hypothetical protein EME01_55380 [Sinorhizobium meliloti]
MEASCAIDVPDRQHPPTKIDSVVQISRFLMPVLLFSGKMGMRNPFPAKQA